VPLSELPLSAQVVLFLTIFVLIGIYPFIKKSMAQLRRLMDARDKPRELFGSRVKELHQEIFPQQLIGGMPIGTTEEILPYLILERITLTNRLSLKSMERIYIRKQMRMEVIYGLLIQIILMLYRFIQLSGM